MKPSVYLAYPARPGSREVSGVVPPRSLACSSGVRRRKANVKAAVVRINAHLEQEPIPSEYENNSGKVESLPWAFD
ncbi:MAG: hypothetical protein M3Y27_31170 [Acidobacteriota bacterium]|nr:hypothetical protein [Acidobacteriota bacterium]